MMAELADGSLIGISIHFFLFKILTLSASWSLGKLLRLLYYFYIFSIDSIGILGRLYIVYVYAIFNIL